MTARKAVATPALAGGGRRSVRRAGVTVWAVVGRGRDGGDAGRGRETWRRDAAVTPADGGRAVEAKIVGTWLEVANDPKRRRVEGRRTKPTVRSACP